MADDKPDEPKAEEKPTEKRVAPHGAVTMRTLRSGLNDIIGRVTKMAEALDDCPAKKDIGKVIASLGDHATSLEGSWGKYYKDHDMDAVDDMGDDPADDGMKADEPEKKPEEASADDGMTDEQIDEALAALDDDTEPAPDKKPDAEPEKKPEAKADEPADKDEEDELSPTEKRHLESRIKRLERLAATN